MGGNLDGGPSEAWLGAPYPRYISDEWTCPCGDAIDHNPLYLFVPTKTSFEW